MYSRQSNDPYPTKSHVLILEAVSISSYLTEDNRVVEGSGLLTSWFGIMRLLMDR